MKFVRSTGHNKIKLGYGKSKRKQKWRRARGRHNKVREKRKGRIQKVEIGFRTDNKYRNTINGNIPIFIKNVNDLKKVKKNEAVIIARIGRKKRMELETKIKEIGANILNVRRQNESKN